ncbi:MAG: c-type cytochrome, partial [Phenylobacterium sp.]
MRLGIWAAALMGATLFAAPLAATAQTSAGETVFSTRCKACHEPAIDRAPNRTALSSYQPAQIVQALTNGVMAPMAQGLSDADKAAVAAYLTTPQAGPDAHPQ